jgi:outer membrane lipoprotein-sorting protein
MDSSDDPWRPEAFDFKVRRREKGAVLIAMPGDDDTLWLDEKTGLPTKRVTRYVESSRDVWTIVETYSDVTLDEKFDAALFERPK